jgi:DNA (cytosine-5)-methyltransferase 1
MRHGSLFSGIGGFDLASEWMGWENVFHCEWNEFGQKVLKHYWPKAISYNDITKTDFSVHRGTIDIITGGFPCQPYSMVGKRLGKEDERHLWPEMLRCIREVQPTWVVGENVLGLVNWNGGLVFHEVQAELEAQGYEVQPYVLPAASVNAPHRRDRVWFVAYSASASEGAKEFRQIRRENGKINREGAQAIYDAVRPDGIEGTATDTRKFRLEQCENTTEMAGRQAKVSRERDKSSLQSKTNGEIRNAPDSNGIGLWGQGNRIGESEFFGQNGQIRNWDNFPTVSPICSRNDGISDRLDGITFSKWRAESIKAGGNAIVPQVVHQIFKAIEQYETTRHTQGTQT